MATSWLVRPRPAADPRLRLLCFPYAGRGASALRPMAEGLPAGVEVSIAQLPGRESRFNEPAMTRMAPLVAALAPSVLPLLDRPCAFFGHSMGAAIAFELTRHLRSGGHPVPVCLMVSGRRAPQSPRRMAPLHALPDPQFLDALRRLGGIPAAVEREPELLKLMLPVVRADFQLLETHVHRDEPPLEIPITAYGGRSDPEVEESEIEEWRSQTRGAFTLRMFAGDHFFIHDEASGFLRAFRQDLEALLLARG
jgi:surfactin synthase thioesterase subunit